MRRRSELASGLLWTAPWWLGFLGLLLVPMGYSLYISFCDYPLLQSPVFIGFENYQSLARDPVYHQVVFNTLIYAGLAVPIATVVAIGLACLLNQQVRGVAFFRACIFIPTIVPLVTAGIIWMWMLNPEYGVVNRLIGLFGSEGPQWLERTPWAMVSLVIVSVWFVGTPMVIYLAGLQDIPGELYEAATLDGASMPRRFWHVTLPGLSPVILFNVVVGLITAFQVFALPFVMWRMRPGPNGSTYFYTTYVFDNAFRYLKMGYASAMAWIQLLIILALTGVVFWAGRRLVYYRSE